MQSKFDEMLAHIKKPLSDTRNAPPVHLTNPAAEFINNRVQINDPKDLVKTHEDSIPPFTGHSQNQLSLRDQGVVAGTVDPKPRCDEADRHCKHFEDVLQSFESTLPEKYKTRFDLHTKHNWSEVIGEAKIAEMKYKKKGDSESPFGRVRGYFRVLQKGSGAIDGWMDILPTQSTYASVICGGFKMVLRAAARMNDIRDFVVQALAAIPAEVEKAQLMINYHQDLEPTQRLYDRVSQLYVTVFQILEHIVVWYSQNSALRHVKAMVQQSAYEKSLESQVNIFKESVAAVKEEANLCSYSRLHDMDSRMDKQHTEVVTALSQHTELIESLYNLLLSDPKLDTRTHQPIPHQFSQVPHRKAKAISRQSLCHAVLRYDDAIPPEDLATIIHRGSELTLKEQDRVVYVIENQLMREWLMSPRNSALLINGKCTNLDTGGNTMSFLAAHLLQSALHTQKSRMLSLYWFAGQHRNVLRDSEANVHGIMRSLIGQLVNLYKGFDLYFIKRSTATAICEEDDLEVLCNVFDELIYQLPKNTLTFCVIDWLACLEYDNKQDVLFLVQRLHTIAQHANEKGSLFKLLLTHAGGTFWAAAEFEAKGEVLAVPEDTGGNRMGFNKLMWNANVGDKVGDLAVGLKR